MKLMNIAYLFVAFIVFFFVWKKKSAEFKKEWKTIKENINYRRVSLLDLLTIEQSLILIAFPLLWPITLPGYIMWQLLESIYKKFTKTIEK